MIYQAARWRKRGVGSGGDGGGVGGGGAGACGLEGGGRCSAAIAMVNRVSKSNKGASISPDVDGDSDLVRYLVPVLKKLGCTKKDCNLNFAHSCR